MNTITTTRKAVLKNKPDNLAKASTLEYIGVRIIPVKKNADYQVMVVNNDRIAGFHQIEFGAFRNLTDRLELSQDDIQHVFHVSPRTYLRRKTMKTPFVGLEADLIVRVADVYRYAEEVFQNSKKAHHWMRSPRAYLNGQRPVDLLSTAVGIEAVKEYLGRIDHGIFA
jgi:putative toxin-antitoxin system antitoxin component (TIGR02293 family)